MNLMCDYDEAFTRMEMYEETGYCLNCEVNLECPMHIKAVEERYGVKPQPIKEPGSLEKIIDARLGKLVSRFRELDELYTKLQAVTGFTAEQLLEMFSAGYTLERPDYSKSFEKMASLAETTPPNEPLTLEQLREIDGDKINIHYIGDCVGFYDDETAPYYGDLEQYIQRYNGMLRACDLPLKYYGVQWTATLYHCTQKRNG